MKNALASISVLGLIVFIALCFGPLALSIYGIVLAFKASAVVGLLALLVEPSPLIIGFAAFFCHVDLAQRMAQALGLQ
jgi:hypothetical protein